MDHSPVPNTYCGLVWTDFDYVDKRYYADFYPDSGYVQIDTIGTIVGLVPNYKTGRLHAAVAGATFSLESMKLTPAWNKQLDVSIKGYNASGQEVASMDIQLESPSVTRPVTFDSSFKNIVEVSITGSRGFFDDSLVTTNNGCRYQYCTQVVVDDIVISGEAGLYVA